MASHITKSKAKSLLNPARPTWSAFQPGPTSWSSSCPLLQSQRPPCSSSGAGSELLSQTFAPAVPSYVHTFAKRPCPSSPSNLPPDSSLALSVFFFLSPSNILIFYFLFACFIFVSSVHHGVFIASNSAWHIIVQ